MPQSLVRQFSTLAVCASFCVGCGSDQNRPANTPDEVPPSSPPADSIAPPGEPNPSGQPSGMPPADPQSLSEPGSSPAQTSAPPPATVAPLSQNQIAMVTELANTAEIEQGKLAQNKAKVPSVKKFASMMVKHHSEAKQEQAKLFQKLNLTPMQSQQSSALKSAGDDIMGSLRGTDADTFDLAYMNSQVQAHQKVLETLDRDLLPAASDPALIDSLKKMRGTVESHLTEAKAVVAQLSKPNTSDARATTR